MDAQAFQRICEKSGFHPAEKQKHRLGNVLIAEKFFNQFIDSDGKIWGPHWQVLWSIERDDMKEAQKLFITGQEDGYPTPLAIPKKVRAATAKLTAVSWMEDAEEIGRYQ